MDSRVSQLRSWVAAFDRMEDMENMPAALGLANELKNWLVREQIFSANEEIEDVLTEHLQYFLIEYYHGEIILKQTDMEARQANLNHAEGCFEAFLHRLKDYRILDPERERRWKEPAAQPSRDEKIAQYREGKALEEKIKLLNERGENEPRELYLTLIQQAINKTLENLKFIKMEGEMLEIKRSGYQPPPPPANRPLQAVRIDESNVHELPQVINSLSDLQKREDIKARVFQPGYNLPTMTLDEYAEMEMKQAREREEAQAAKPPENSDSDDEEVAERKRKKASDWDDWKDEHEKGAGNRNGR